MKRVFARAPSSDSQWLYCGELDDVAGVLTGIRHLMTEDIAALNSGETDELTIELKVRSMTDAEVKALPDI